MTTTRQTTPVAPAVQVLDAALKAEWAVGRDDGLNGGPDLVRIYRAYLVAALGGASHQEALRAAEAEAAKRALFAGEPQAALEFLRGLKEEA